MHKWRKRAGGKVLIFKGGREEGRRRRREGGRGDKTGRQGYWLERKGGSNREREERGEFWEWGSRGEREVRMINKGEVKR